MPPRLRVRFTLPQKGGAPQHVATDYRVPITEPAKACVARELGKTSFPDAEGGLGVIVVRAFDTR